MPNNPPDWFTEVVRAVRDVVGSNARTARLAALLLVLALAVAAATWGYLVFTAPDTHVQVSVTVTNR